MIRNVQITDAVSIAEIYNYYIKETTITFEEELVTEAEIVKRIKEILAKRHPYIVYEKDKKVIGYAYLNNWRSRSAYDITLETSLYLDNKVVAQGIGSALFEELILRAKQNNIHSLIGVISLPNDASRKIHEKYNFKLVGNFKESGKKFGKLIDVEFWQLIIDQK